MEKRASCGKLFKQISNELQKRADNKMRSRDLTMAQVEALWELHHAPGEQLSMKQLEKNLRIAQSTTAGIISRLEQKKMVEGCGDPSDKRLKLVRLTRLGTERILEAERDMEQTERMLLSGLTETEQSILYSLLKKVRDTLK